MMKKKMSLIKACALIFLSCALVFGSAGLVLNARADEKRIKSGTITIDYGDYDGKDLPSGMVGKSYPVFAYNAIDNAGNPVSDVRITVKNPNGEIVPQKNGRFETAIKGEYTISYVAISGIVSTEKTIKINVEKYTDTMSYNATDENIPTSGNTGNVILANFGSFSGGVGDLSFETVLKLGGKDVDFTETEKGIYFIPEKSGEYSLVYSAYDFVADKKSAEKTITVTDSDIPVMQKPSVTSLAIAGETLELPLPDGVLYRNGAKYHLPVSVYYDGAEVGSDMQVKDLKAGEHTVKYECVSPLNSAKKAEYTFNLTVKDKKQAAGSRLFDNYFDFNNCEPFTTADNAYGVRVGSGNASFAFSRMIPVEFINFDISTKDGLAAYGEIYMVITDSKNADDCAKVRIKRLSSYNVLSISYDDKTRSLINSNDKSVLGQIKSYADGRTFEGFKSGKAYISFEVKDVKKQAEFTLTKVASTAITADSLDYAPPVFFADNDFRSAYVSYIGHSVYLPELKAFDLLEDNIEVTLTIFDETGTIYQGEGGYTFNITKSGEYSCRYEAIDSYGNRKRQDVSITVGDQVSPVIKVSGIKARVSVGEEIVLPEAEISDNNTATERITSYIYVLKGNNEKKLVSGSYRFDEAGKYIIRYVAYDNNQNYTVVEFTVICK